MPTLLRVLIVDDSDDDANLVIRKLRGGNYEPQWERVDTAEAMKNALEREEWDIILCDYKMPNFSAQAALRLAQKKKSIFLSLSFPALSEKIRPWKR
jgi:CheY-like chemotaxis protein